MDLSGYVTEAAEAVKFKLSKLYSSSFCSQLN
jgi:hypothetical protein